MNYGTLPPNLLVFPPKNFERAYYKEVAESARSLDPLALPVCGQPVPIEPYEMATEQDADPALRKLKEQIRANNLVPDQEFTTHYPTYRFLSADFPLLRLQR